MFKRKHRTEQGSFWADTHELVTPKAFPLHRALDAILTENGFGPRIREWSAPCYKMNGPGYPGVDPKVYFKMLMVGIFDGIQSERGIDERCSDSRGIRAFLGYGITEETPCCATLGNIRRRLGEYVFEKVFGLLQEKLADEKLLRGNHLGIDTSGDQRQLDFLFGGNYNSGFAESRLNMETPLTNQSSPWSQTTK